MYLKALEVFNFRNYLYAKTALDPGINVIIGDNAQGKTNLLEAVFFMTCGKSFRAKNDRELIRIGSDFAEIKTSVQTADREITLTAQIPQTGRKSFQVNGVKLRTVSELRGRLSAVLFCPDDLKSIKEGAVVHRRLMDVALFQLRPRYALLISEFTKLYNHKTRILRDSREKPSLLETLDDYNLRLARIGAEIIRYRAAFVEKLSEKAAVIHSEFSGSKEKLSIGYKTVKTVKDPLNESIQQIFEELLRHQTDHRSAEIESGQCLSGVHKDDLEIEINSLSAKTFASQGQIRTAALSIKLAERDIHFAETGEYPILLLDDVLSELDASRQSFVLNRILDGQVLITCCEDDGIREKTGEYVIKVSDGKILK